MRLDAIGVNRVQVEQRVCVLCRRCGISEADDIQLAGVHVLAACQRVLVPAAMLQCPAAPEH